MRYILILVLSISSILSINAQSLSIEESKPMEEMRKGWMKLLQLKNGNTVMIHMTYELGTHIWIYNNARTLIVDKIIQPVYGESNIIMREAKVEGVFSISDKIILFLNTTIDKYPILYRTIIDANDGSLLKTEEIGRLDKNTYTGIRYYNYGVTGSRFVIRKDADSDNYGVAIFNNSNARNIELIHFNKNNEQINKVSYTLKEKSKSEKFDWSMLIDLIVRGDEKLIAFINVPALKDTKSNVSIASLVKGSSELKVKQIDFVNDRTFSAGITLQ